jgi:hypothetical protein
MAPRKIGGKLGTETLGGNWGQRPLFAVTNTFGSYQLRQADRIVESLEGIRAEDLGRLVLDKQAQPPFAGDLGPMADPQARQKTGIKTLN